MKAAMILGADGVQIGSRFAATVKQSAHENGKKIVETQEGRDTQLTLKELAPVRLVKNKFFMNWKKFTKKEKILKLCRRNSGNEEQTWNVRRRFRRRRIEIGQSSALIDEIFNSRTSFQKLLKEFEDADFRNFKI